MKIKKLVFVCLLTLCSWTLTAKTVNVETAQKAAQNFLRFNTHLQAANLTLAQRVQSKIGNTSFYIFDINHSGFIIVSADDVVEPILGYSLNGAYDSTRTSPTFQDWIKAYRDDISQIISQYKSGKGTYHNAEAAREWNALNEGISAYYNRKAAKSVSPLLSSQWDQSYGYNNYCPAYNGGHAVVGCVATAMAQIIRYYGYPSTGFGTSSYAHSVYGRQTAYHDSVVYDFSHMPDEITYYSTQTEQNAVSLLGYHCGVSVHMNYQSQLNTDGSGAQVSDVPDALKHFGYFGSYFLYKNDVSDSVWTALVRHELDLGHPLLYQGFEGTYGHAFVCDGYNSNNNKYHFNWGWSGYQDGFFTLTDMNGYTTGQGAVFNIVPSGIGHGNSIIYVAANGTGNGSSWDSATAQLSAAIQVQGIYKNGAVFVKEGTYYGDSLGTSAFTMCSGVKIYGGFAGTESSTTTRQIALHPTILDGHNKRSVVACPSLNKNTTLDGFIIQGGLSDNAAALTIKDYLTVQNCTIRNNHSTLGGNIVVMENGGTLKKTTMTSNQADSGAALLLKGTSAQTCNINNNTCSSAVMLQSNATLYSSLIAHNDGMGADAQYGRIINCNIVGNSNVGVRKTSRTNLRNCIVWNNAASLQGDDTATITYCAIEGSTPYPGEGNIMLNSVVSSTDAPQPQFTFANTTRGLFSGEESWRLLSTSPCINSGDTITSGIPTVDLDGKSRIYDGRIDMGCYEYNGVGIAEPVAATAVKVWPNPTAGTLMVTVETAENSDHTSNLVLYDMSGRMLLCQPHTQGSAILDLSALPRGIYILKCGVATTKIVKR